MYPSLPIEKYTLQTPRPNAQILYKQGLQQSTTTVDAATGHNNHYLLCIPCWTLLYDTTTRECQLSGAYRMPADMPCLHRSRKRVWCLEYQVPKERGQGLKAVKGKSNPNMDSWSNRNDDYYSTSH